MICPNCNAEVSDSMKFCENCGVALPASGITQVDASPADDTTAAFTQPADSPSFPQNDYVQTQPDAALFGGTISGPDGTQPYTPQGEMPFSEPYVPYTPAQQYEQPTGQPYGQQFTSQPYEQPASQPYSNPQQFGQQTAGQQGYAPTPPGVYAPASTGPQVSGTPFVLAIIALVTSILGLFPVSIVLAIIALVMNSGQKKRGEFSTKQNPTKIMSIVSLVISSLVLIAAIALGGIISSYLASEGYNISSNGNGSISITAPKSSSSSAAGGAKASSSASSSSGTSSSSSAATSTGSVTDKLVGNWKLTGLISDGEVSSSDDIELMQNMGLTVELALNADGSAVLTLFGVEMGGIWESSDGQIVYFMLEGDRVIATVSGNELTMADGDDVLTFTKE